MAKLNDFYRVRKILEGKAKESIRSHNVSVITGYEGVPYALQVHENVEMKGKGMPRRSGNGTYWDNGEPKFLEKPARELAPIFGKEVLLLVASGRTVLQALLIVGLRLQRESQKLAPKDTGNLRGSAFTRAE